MPADQRRASIVEAARQLLVDRGITFTTRQVAEAAGIAEGTVFRHFSTKGDLVRAVVDDVFDPGPLCREIDATPSGLDLTGAVRHALRLMQGRFQTITAVTTSLHPRQRPPQPPHEPSEDPHRGILRWHAAVTASLTALLNRYQDRLRIPVDQAGTLLMSAVLLDMRPSSVPIHRFGDAELADIILNGIAVPPSPRPTSPLAQSQEPACS